jgi:hypothetical protein
MKKKKAKVFISLDTGEFCETITRELLQEIKPVFRKDILRMSAGTPNEHD